MGVLKGLRMKKTRSAATASGRCAGLRRDGREKALLHDVQKSIELNPFVPGHYKETLGRRVV